MTKEKTFAGFPRCPDLAQLNTDIALIGIPYGTPYEHENSPPCLHAPGIIRRESNRYQDDRVAWDFDLDGTLFSDSGKRMADCGDLPGSQDDPVGNRNHAREAIATILEKKAVPIVLGGDDSIPIPVMRAYEGREPFHVLQLDAHIDWRNAVEGVRDGYSSTVRRASELACVSGIVQAGMRGVGSARQREMNAAAEYGVEIVLAKTIMQEGSQAVLQHLPEGGRCFLTIDFDVLDPSVMPAVGAPTPGGLDYQTLIDIIHGAAAGTEIVGVCLVEFIPEADLQNLGAITAMRVVWNVIGALVRNC
jgi:agmatinase